MVLSGKLSVEVGIHSSADEFYHFIVTKQNHIQHVTQRVHHTKLHQGEWHITGSDNIKHWTYLIDGKVTTCKEHIESIDEQSKRNVYILYDGDVSKHYKIFKLIFEVFGNKDGQASVKWTFEYEKINEDVEPPYGYMDYFATLTKDCDAHLVKA